jgi:xylulokinase
MAVYLGLDCSTQSLTAIAIEVTERDRRVVFEHSMQFESEFPEYGTVRGVFRHANPLEVTSSPVMWAAALDRMMSTISTQRAFDVSRLRAIAGSGQQHGSVYLNDSAEPVWSRLDPRQQLAAQISGIFSRAESPVWMDASTRRECDAIEESVGGPEKLAWLTGSRAFERFTAAQIRKFIEQQPDAWERTDRVHLVSSYMASLLAGRHAPIDPGDGSGMNLMDIRSLQWAPAALDATAPGLERRLPPVQPSWSVVGSLARYWQDRYRLPDASIIAWSGDNPCSLVGAGLIRQGHVCVSLGTSDTLFGYTLEPRVDARGASHVFCSPTGGYMSLICYRNGSLAREQIRDAYGLGWSEFDAALRATPAGNRGAIMLPWFEAEITPPVRTPGVRRSGLDAEDAAANVRAVVEAQMLSMTIHSPWSEEPVHSIRATGGASESREILQVLADVFGAEVCQMKGGNSACLGAALRAYHAGERARGRDVAWEAVISGFTDPVAESRVAPIAANVATYAEMRRRYAEYEREALT